MGQVFQGGARTTEVVPRTEANCVRTGQPHKPTPHRQRETGAGHQAGESLLAIAGSYNVYHATVESEDETF